MLCRPGSRRAGLPHTIEGVLRSTKGEDCLDVTRPEEWVEAVQHVLIKKDGAECIRKVAERVFPRHVIQLDR